MPIRIYALAKELKIDSKQLVDVCNRAGVSGKGSALASLDDDEIAKVKAFISKKDEPARPKRPAASAGSSGIKTIVTKSRTSVSTEETAVDEVAAIVAAVDVPDTEDAVVESVTVEQPAAESVADVLSPVPDAESPSDEALVAVDDATTEAEVEAEVEAPPASETAEQRSSARPLGKSPGLVSRRSAGSAPPLAAITRGDYISSGRGTGKIRVIKTGPQKPSAGNGGSAGNDDAKAPVKRGPIIKLAAMPKAKQPVAPKKSSEPAPQKPIMTLPKDAIQGAKAGAKAPLEQFTKHQDRKRKEDLKPAGSRPPMVGDADTRRDKAGKKGKKGVRGGEGANAGSSGDGRGNAGMAAGRSARQTGRRGGSRGFSGGDDRGRRRRPMRLRRKGTNTAAPRKGKVSLELPCTVRTFSEASGVPSVKIQRALMAMGTMATINAELDAEMANMLALELEVELEFVEPATLEEQLIGRLEQQEDAPEDLVARPPIVTFLGHVDHGKTSLLDHIIGVNVVKGEAGGITQHIRAYTVKKGDRRISFVDTPGHEAFTEMRARGANVTDIAVLVIAADDGIMPQTEEAIAHAQAAEVPIVVALNKIDVPGADADRVLQQLATHGLLPVEWGGDIEVVKTSAITGEGMDDLLETLFLTAELHEYTANPSREASGVCLEAEQESGRGVIAKLIVRNGSLKVGDVIVCGSSHGRVKAMYDTLKPKARVKIAPPATPVNVTGLNVAPGAGDMFYVLDDVAKARELAEQRQDSSRQESLGGTSIKVSFEEFQERLAAGKLSDTGDVSVLNLIIRADVRGSIEAIIKEFEKLEHPEVKLNILQTSVGGVTIGDVTLADASDAVIVGFNVIPDENARALADQRGVEIRRYDIIYKVTDDLRAMLEGRLKPEERVKNLGRALVQQLFHVSRMGTIAGCRVLAGTIERGCRIRVNRDGRGIGDYDLDSLRRLKDDSKEVREGFECGMKLSGFNDLKEGDVLEAYKIEEVARTM